MKRSSSSYDGDSDCDIWNYKSQNNCKAKKNKLSVKERACVRVSKTAPRPPGTKEEHQAITVDRCPSCQAPFQLIAEALRLHHVHSCLELISTLNTECAEEEFCISNDIKHFSLYRHDKLAYVHAGLQHDNALPCENNGTRELTESSKQSIFHAKVTRNESFSVSSSLNSADGSTYQNSEACNGSVTSSVDINCALDTVDKDDSLLSYRCEVPSVECTPPKEEYDVISFASSKDSHSDVMSPDVLAELQNEFFEYSENDLEAEPAVFPCASVEIGTLETTWHKTGSNQYVTKQPKVNVKKAKGCALPANQRSIKSFFMSTVLPNKSTLTTNPESISCTPEKAVSSQPNNPISRLISAVVGGAAKLCGQVYNSKTSESSDEKHKVANGNVEKSSTISSARVGVSSSMAHHDSTAVEPYGITGGYAKKCPFYKRIPNTSFSVDAFSYGTIPGCTAYFLSHFHYDHYCGLNRSFKHTIYCSQATANLVLLKIRVNPRCVKALPIGAPQMIDSVEITLLDANHCPGSVMFLYKVKQAGNEEVYLHTGDFRADRSLQYYPQLQSLQVNQLFLDTTYCNPTYAFPPQQHVIDFAIRVTKDFLNTHPKTLIVVGTYTIGKERIFTAIADALDCKICVTLDKKRILDCIDDDSVNRRLTLTKNEARVHVVSMKQLNIEDLTAYLSPLRHKFDHVLAFEPTGWTHSSKTLSVNNIRPRVCNSQLTIYGVPYSEHSSYEELKEFVQFLRPQKIIPTVNNGDARSRQKMSELFNSWMSAPVSKGAVSRQSAMNEWLK